jgi:hypothetical protein
VTKRNQTASSTAESVPDGSRSLLEPTRHPEGHEGGAIMKDNQVVFDASDAREAYETLRECHWMLLIGLASFGEIERLQNAHIIHGRFTEIHEDLRVTHPTGSAETVRKFAEALINLDILMRQMRDLDTEEGGEAATAVLARALS